MIFILINHQYIKLWIFAENVELMSLQGLLNKKRSNTKTILLLLRQKTTFNGEKNGCNGN